MSILKKIFNRQPPAATKGNLPRIIEVRSQYGAAFHFLDTSVRGGEKHAAMCGYENWVHTNSPIEVTEEKVRAALPNQHDGWFYCKQCLTAFLGDA